MGKSLTLKNSEKLEAWLFAIARKSSWTTMESNIASSSSPDQEAFMDLYNALKRLPPSQKQVIELRFFKNYSIQETAQMMGKTPQAVKMQYRALKMLRNYLKPFDDLERLNNDGEY